MAPLCLRCLEVPSANGDRLCRPCRDHTIGIEATVRMRTGGIPNSDRSSTSPSDSPTFVSPPVIAPTTAATAADTKACSKCKHIRTIADFEDSTRRGIVVRQKCLPCRERARAQDQRRVRNQVASVNDDGTMLCGTCHISKPAAKFAVHDRLSKKCEECRASHYAWSSANRASIRADDDDAFRAHNAARMREYRARSRDV